MDTKIKIIGAKEHNLKDVSIEIPRDKFVVITGVSGSGKSTLAFDTVYAEGQRRYVESLSTHSRQFLNQMSKPNIDSIEGLSPAISIQQRVSAGSPRSTVGTTTEIYDYLRLLFSRIGQRQCPECGKVIQKQSPQEIIEQINKLSNGKKLQILAPVVKGKKGSLRNIIKDLQRSGYTRMRLDGTLCEIESPPDYRSNLTHDIDVVVDRLLVKEDDEKRLSESIKVALDMGRGVCMALIGENDEKEYFFSELNACMACSVSFGDLTPSMFSFNSPFGACETCHGLGEINYPDTELLVVDETRSIIEGAIPVITIEDAPMLASHKRILDFLAKRHGVDLKKPWKVLPEEIKDLILNGRDDVVIRTSVFRAGREEVSEEKFEGFARIVYKRFTNTEKSQPKEIIKRYLSKHPCFVCEGKRLRRESLAVSIGGYSIIDITNSSIERLLGILKKIELNNFQEKVGSEIIKEVIARLEFLNNVGLGYLTLSRKSNTLAGGEAQRIKLATQIGSGLMGVLYILDEPSIGLHSRDNDRLLNSLKKLQALGNSVIVVEHDEDTILAADHVIEMGPGAGVYGGEVVFQGTIKEMFEHGGSQTAKYLLRAVEMPVPKKRRIINKDNVITLSGCTENNLRNVSVDFPLNCLLSVTGVSGSGKSTLVNKILYKALQKQLSRARVHPGKYKKITGFKGLEAVIDISQAAIGRTPRSNPATYTGLFDLVRDWYANLPEAKIRGFKASHFSFNVRGGRCEACSGDGMRKIEMHFMPDVYVPCEVCNGERYDREILKVKYQGKNISNVLRSTVTEAIEIFKNIASIKEKLELLRDVGLGYITLGQSATTLSGGEAQRIKLASELGCRSKGPCVYILDEPTTGLHFADIHNLLNVIQRLVDYGHTVIVIEHNLEVIYASDYVIDLGPDGGDKGGKIVGSGTPEEVMEIEKSFTGKYLKEHASKLEKLITKKINGSGGKTKKEIPKKTTKKKAVKKAVKK